MTHQLDWCTADLPRSRRRDPMTSRLAARRVAPVYHGQKADVLRIVRDHPLRTAVELAQLWAVERGITDAGAVKDLRYVVSRRTADLARDGAIRRCPPRICTVSGTAQTTWRAV